MVHQLIDHWWWLRSPAGEPSGYSLVQRSTSEAWLVFPGFPRQNGGLPELPQSFGNFVWKMWKMIMADVFLICTLFSETPKNEDGWETILRYHAITIAMCVCVINFDTTVFFVWYWEWGHRWGHWKLNGMAIMGPWPVWEVPSCQRFKETPPGATLGSGKIPKYWHQNEPLRHDFCWLVWQMRIFYLGFRWFIDKTIITPNDDHYVNVIYIYI